MRIDFSVFSTTSLAFTIATGALLSGCGGKIDASDEEQVSETVAASTTFPIVFPSANQNAPVPSADPFYTPPAGWQSVPNGTLLQYRSTNQPALVNSWQFMVRSSDLNGNPVPITGTLMTNGNWHPGHPLIAYNAAIDSLGATCNPSYEILTGGEGELIPMELVIDEQWAVVATDYEGPNNEFEVGKSEGRAILDGILAAETMLLTGTSTPVGMWGYSGGGTATAWAAQLAHTYAPQIKFSGVAYGGTPQTYADLEHLDGTVNSGLLLIGMVGASRGYPTLPPLFNAAGQSMVQAVGSMCGGTIASTSAYQYNYVQSYTNTSPIWTNAAVQAVFADETLGGTAPSMPLYHYQGLNDELIPYQSGLNLHNAYCSLGASEEFVEYTASGENHIWTAITGAMPALSWLSSQFSGGGTGNNCGQSGASSAATGGTSFTIGW